MRIRIILSVNARRKKAPPGRGLVGEGLQSRDSTMSPYPHVDRRGEPSAHR